MELSSGEKLIITMLSDLFETLKVKSEIDPKFVKEMIYGDTLWALTWQYPGLFSGAADTPPEVRKVLDILNMWSWMEEAYNALSPADKERIKVEAAPFGDDVDFPGFDGNEEVEYLHAAHVLTEQLDRYKEFKGRVLNSHSPMIDAYSRMVTTFQRLRSAGHKQLDATDIIEILKEQIHPENR